MAYYIGAFKSGYTNTSDITVYTRNMDMVNIFAGKVKYNATGGSNTYSVMKPFQFKDGVGRFIIEEAGILFPAPWPWIPRPDVIKGTDHSILLSLFANPHGRDQA